LWNFFNQIIDDIKIIQEKGEGRITLDDIGGRKCLGYMYGSSGYGGKISMSSSRGQKRM